MELTMRRPSSPRRWLGSFRVPATCQQRPTHLLLSHASLPSTPYWALWNLAAKLDIYPLDSATNDCRVPQLERIMFPALDHNVTCRGKTSIAERSRLIEDPAGGTVQVSIQVCLSLNSRFEALWASNLSFFLSFQQSLFFCSRSLQQSFIRQVTLYYSHSLPILPFHLAFSA